MDLKLRTRRIASGKSRRATRPSIEGLEDRFLLYSTTGGKFAYGSRITYSFVPDGTNVGGPTSNLFSSMDSRFSRAAWQAAFANAAATWSSVANINIVQVPDNGATMGSYGFQQGSPYYGDIRIGGLNLGTTTMATTFTPPPYNGGTLAGDMLFNTSLPWQINHDYDLQTVAIHEFGHALGLGHSSVAGAQLNAIYGGVNQSLTTDDVNGIRAIWGPRAPDWSSQGVGNFTPETATNPMRFLSSSNQITLYDLNITNNFDQHWYKVVTPPNASTNLTAVIQSANLSMLSPKVQIFNAGLAGLAQGTAPYSYGTYVGATVTNATPNTTYYIRTSPANAGVSGAGNYALFINMGTAALTPVAPPYTTVNWQPDQGGGSMGLGDGQAHEVAGHVNFDDHHHSEIVTIGDLSGYGCELKVGDLPTRPTRAEPTLTGVPSHLVRFVNVGAIPETGSGSGADPTQAFVGFQHPSGYGESNFVNGPRGRGARYRLPVTA